MLPPRVRPPSLKFGRLGALCMGLVLGLGSLVGCNRDTCAGLHPPTADADAPKIVEMAIVSQDIINPWQFNMALTFTDRNGDLGSGLLDIYVGTSEPVTLNLAPYFATSGVAPNSTAGRLGIDLNVASSSVQDDSMVRLGFQVRDALLNYSNCYTMDMHFDVDKLGSWLPGKVRQRRCGELRLALRGTGT